MRLEEMVQHMQQYQHSFFVSNRLCAADIVHDHIANSVAAMLLRQQVLSERSGSNFRKMFVLGDREDFLFTQATEADTIFEGDHAIVMTYCWST